MFYFPTNLTRHERRCVRKLKRRNASSYRLHYALSIQLYLVEDFMLRIRWAVLRPSTQVLHWACDQAFALKALLSWSKSLHNIPKLALTDELVIPMFRGELP